MINNEILMSDIDQIKESIDKMDVVIVTGKQIGRAHV